MIIVILFITAISLTGCGASGRSEQNVSLSHPTSGDSIQLPKIMVPSSEPGDRLTVTGVIYDADRATPLQGVTVYVYHTDANGYYTLKGNDPRNPRLHATLITDSLGRYAFTTIKPGHYPSGQNPAHIHFVISGKAHSQQNFELLFEGDPLISKTDSIRNARMGQFGFIKSLLIDSGGHLRCAFDISLKK